MPQPSVFAKMNLKDQSEILVLNAPDSFEPEVSRLRGVKVRRGLSGVSQIAFALAFVTLKRNAAYAMSKGGKARTVGKRR
jgi:hypothetical protein